MPSGSRRRKAAARKKKEQGTSNNNNTSSSTDNNNNSNISGNNDPKSQDERESDGGEVNSPMSQQHPFKEESEELETRDPSPVRSLVSDNKSMEEVSGDVGHADIVEIDDGGAIKVEGELKSEEDLESQIIDIKLKESNDRSSSSSSSSSDDESQVGEKKTEEVAYGSVSEALSLNGENKPVESAYASISEVISHNGENKPVESLLEEVIQITEKASFKEVDKLVVDAVTTVDSVEPLAAVTEVNSVTESDTIVPDSVETRLKEIEESKRSEDKVFPTSEDNVGAPSTVVESIAPLTVDAVTTVDSVKPLAAVTEELNSVAQSDTIENSLVPDSVETRLKETEESKRSEDNVFPITEDNVGAPSTVVESISNGKESKVLPSSEPPIAETSYSAEYIRDSEIPDSSEKRPFFGSAPQAAERTSWMSCCGLLDVLTGSSR
ncbi:general transcriptional corepressor trfA-like isoform X1 [Mangifera indica]|uniref:general transcriptional corepressor trfA-like isoform X1 n=1 Tax=Mangifera indica TaxID=29780 RepID=UPI001CFC0E71|nr:general transcriptional corepressor trfA-like isoform X1 [Mangifera indica]XP_044496984.1 general transcriptional corepressor trfA-like isoform X1 [Mangifera indica]